jgi:hypothetical protein
MPHSVLRPRVRALLSLMVLLAGCSRNEPREQTTFYSRRIGPLLQQSCAASPTNSGCHVVADDRGNALGNLSVESYDNLLLRRDLLVNYGPYGVPGLLLKVVPSFKLSLTSFRSSEPTLISTDIVHAGNQQVDFESPTFTTLEKWMAGGAAENNAPQVTRVIAEPGCSDVLGTDALFDPTLAPTAPDFATFQSAINPILGERCASGNCHGSAANSLHLTCGDTPEQVRWNYFVAGDYVSADARSSEILLRTLSPAAGGSYHEGGSFWDSVDDPGYQAILAWATEKGGPSQLPSDPGFELFASRVQPMLVKRGCMMLGCHSAAMFHDYRLRGGSGGHFGLPATRKNYELTLEQVALESADPNTSRLLRKNLSPQAGGILHRGGPLFAGHGRPEACDLQAAETGPLDSQAPYCVLVAWIAKERAARMASAAPLSAIVYVKRRPRPLPDTPQDWQAFAPGADVVRVAATAGAAGAITLGAETSLSRLCGLDPVSSDARRPAVSWDGQRVAFAARAAESSPFRIYVVAGGACAIDAAIDAAPAVPSNGELVHNLDPSFSPDGRLVFVSTRGNLQENGGLSFLGPQRTPADPSKLNTNLYVRDADGAIRQLTFLLNQEMLPAFMGDGRVIMTTEKRAPDFYQLAGRRINLDGGDYHPLFAQRPTLGFNQLSSVVELADKNLAAIFSERGAAHGAGALGIINRSLGIDQRSESAEDYLVDPSAMDYPNPDFYQRALRFVDPAASGRLASTQGAYAHPAPLPDGRILLSYAANVVNLANFSGDFDVVVVEPTSSTRTPLITGTEDALWPVAVYARHNLGVFRSRLDEANGATQIDPTLDRKAEVTFMDLPLFSSLLFQNTRSGRPIPEGRSRVEVWQSLPPEAGVTSFAGGGSFVFSDRFGQLIVRRALLGELTSHDDGSARLLLPGGMPFVLATDVKLADDSRPTWHFQREEMQVYPGERLRQAFRRNLFNGLCGGCHGAVNGLEDHVAIEPDILTRASVVRARSEPAVDLTGVTPGPAQGPPFP